jgi:hypothetical protein
MAGLYHCVSGCVVPWQACQIGIALVLWRGVVVVGCVPFHENIPYPLTISVVVLLTGNSSSTGNNRLVKENGVHDLAHRWTQVVLM